MTYTLRHAEYEALCGYIEREPTNENPTKEQNRELRARVRDLRPELTGRDLDTQTRWFYNSFRGRR